MVDTQPEFLWSCQLALSVEEAVKLSIAQRGHKRLHLLFIRPAEGLLHPGQGATNLKTSNSRV